MIRLRAIFTAFIIVGASVLAHAQQESQDQTDLRALMRSNAASLTSATSALEAGDWENASHGLIQIAKNALTAQKLPAPRGKDSDWRSRWQDLQESVYTALLALAQHDAVKAKKGLSLIVEFRNLGHGEFRSPTAAP